MHRSSSTVSTTSVTAPSTAAATGGLEADTDLLDFWGSHAMTITFPGQPPVALTNRSTVSGSIPCGSICALSLMLAVDRVGLDLHHIQRPGSPPWRPTSTRTRAS